MNKKYYFTNKKIYIGLTATFVVLSIALALLMSFVKEEKLVMLFSALFGVTGGGIAAVVVAWLLDQSMCNLKNKELNNKVNSGLQSISLWLDNLFQAIVDALEDKNNEYSWKTGITEFYKRDFLKNEKDFSEKILPVYVFLNLLIGEIQVFDRGDIREYYALKEAGFLTELNLLKEALEELKKIIFYNKESNFDYIVELMDDAIKTCIFLNDYDNKSYVFSC